MKRAKITALFILNIPLICYTNPVSKNKIIIILGLTVAILPFLGFPGSFKSPAYFLLGGAIAYITFQENRHRRKHSPLKKIRKSKDVISVPVGNGSFPASAGKQTITSLVEPELNEDRS